MVAPVVDFFRVVFVRLVFNYIASGMLEPVYAGLRELIVINIVSWLLNSQY